MEHDYYGGIIAWIIVIVMVVDTILCIRGKYQELNNRAVEIIKGDHLKLIYKLFFAREDTCNKEVVEF